MTSEPGAVTALEYEPGRWLVEMVGEFDLDNRSELTECVARTPAGTRIIVDLSGVTFIDSATLGVLLDTHNRMQAIDASEPFVLVVPDGSPAHRLLDLTGTDAVFDTRPNRTSAGLPVGG